MPERAVTRTCSVDGCDNRHYGHGYCAAHSRRWRLYGDPTASAPCYTRPFPLAPLTAFVPGSHLHQADVLGIEPKQLSRFKEYGALTVARADELANRVGYHPAEIWGDLWWQQAE